MSNSLKGKKILITAGPTWVPIDDVRVLSNKSSGRLGILLAQKAVSCGMKTDLFLGPVGAVALNKKIRLSRCTYFKEFQELVLGQLKLKKYDCILHCAAVSDYLVQRFKGKISSKKDNLTISLKRAPKIIDFMRKLNPDSFLVMFKLESGVSDTLLVRRAASAMAKSKADLSVANKLEGGKYKGFILDSCGVLAKVISRQELVNNLFCVLREKMI